MITNKPPSKLICTGNIIIVSNRGPVEYSLNQDTTLTYHQGPGGMVTALVNLGSCMESTWISLAMTEGDRFVFSNIEKERDGLLLSPLKGPKMHLRYVVLQEEIFTRYRQISTELLWFAQHYMYPQIQDSKSYEHILDSWVNGYSIANQSIADAIIGEITRRNEKTVVMLHDIDFCLVSSMIRKQHPTAVIQQFLHSPWPDIRYWYLLPEKIIQSMYAGLAGNDILGFQTEHDARNFLNGACAMLDSSIVDFETGVIQWHEHRIQVRTYPISISVVEERRIVQSQEAQEEVAKLRPLLSKKIIMRVDRIDPIKNIIGGFRAYMQMLDEHKELQGEVYFLAFLIPTRETMPTYDQYKAEVFKEVEEINHKYGLDEWQPIHLFVGNNRVRALAALQFYDVLLVNSFFDGMNLIAKEGVVVNQCNGILVLSRTTGVFSQLGKAAIPISPAYTAETAQALYKALMLPDEERSRLAQRARKEVENHDVTQWIALQIQDINRLLEKGEISLASMQE